MLLPNMGVASGSGVPWGAPWITEYWDGSIGITVTGAGVSAWVPVVGTHSLVQGTDASRPTYAAGVLTLDGVAQYLKASAFTANQPVTIGMVVSPIVNTTDKYIWDGDGQNNCGIRQGPTANPTTIKINAGSDVTSVSTLTQGTYYAVLAVYNGASSSVQTNQNTATAGNVGANNFSGATIGVRGDVGALTYSNIAVKAFWYSLSALSAAQITQTQQRVMNRYGL